MPGAVSVGGDNLALVVQGGKGSLRSGVYSDKNIHGFRVGQFFFAVKRFFVVFFLTISPELPIKCLGRLALCKQTFRGSDIESGQENRG